MQPSDFEKHLLDLLGKSLVQAWEEAWTSTWEGQVALQGFGEGLRKAGGTKLWETRRPAMTWWQPLDEGAGPWVCLHRMGYEAELDAARQRIRDRRAYPQILDPLAFIDQFDGVKLLVRHGYTGSSRAVDLDSLFKRPTKP